MKVLRPLCLIVCVTAVLLAAGSAGTHRQATPKPELRPQRVGSSRPVTFEPQAAGDRDAFLARTARYDVTLAADRAVFHLKPAAAAAPPADRSRAARRGPSDRNAIVRGTPPAAIDMTLVGARTRATIEAASPLPGKVNYLLGSDPAAWRRNVPTYARVLTHDAWPGVDVAYYGNAGQVETDFVVAPGGEPDRILLNFSGADGVRLDGDGTLVLTASDGQMLRFLAPAVYQVTGSARTPVSGRYVLDGTPAPDGGRRVHFTIGADDRTNTLVIDPLAAVVVYSTYVDPRGENVSADAVAVDDHGHPFVAGNDAFYSVNSFPMPMFAFVTKYSADGQDILWTTFFGEGVSHSLDDVWDNSCCPTLGYTEAKAIALDGEHAVITGWTNAPHFPRTPGSFLNPSLGVGIGAGPFVYVAKLTDNGDDVVYAVRALAIGEPSGIAVDHAGRAFVVGFTIDDDWIPTTANALIPAMPSYYAGFLIELSADGSKVVYGTYLGPSPAQSEGDTYAAGVAVDSSGAAYLVGTTYTHRFITKNAFQPDDHDRRDCPIDALGGEGFVMKFDTHHHLAYSSYLGGACNDNVTAIAVGGEGAAYVTGTTEGQGFPCLQSTFPCEPLVVPAVFVAKVNSDGNGLIYSTVLGEGYGTSIAARGGNAYITGVTSAWNFPTRRAVQSVIGGGADAFVAALRDDGYGFVFSTFLGGSDYDAGNGIALGVNGGIYVVGSTHSTDFLTHRANRRHDPFGIPNGFLTKFKLETIDTPQDH